MRYVVCHGTRQIKRISFAISLKLIARVDVILQVSPVCTTIINFV